MLILGFDSEVISIENAGGKGLNLARLRGSGLNVPDGFILSTEAYRQFIEHNRLRPVLEVNLAELEREGLSGLERISDKIRGAFAAGELIAPLKDAMRKAYATIERRPLAVRSSATTEDLPEYSFAGQQDTFLNVLDESHLFEAAINCWSSLWTARAIGYRQRNRIPHSGAAVAVVIQAMVQSDISGVLFTANPLTGLRSETVIDATFGLGEALVSGLVEPDHIIFDRMTDTIITKVAGMKQVVVQASDAGGVDVIRQEEPEHLSLTESQINELVAAGDQIQTEFGSPQDIEWAYADDRLYLLQSRAITSLFPVPEYSHDPLIAWMSFGSIQGLLGPMTPLGRNAVSCVLAGAAKLFEVEIQPGDDRIVASAGERLWMRISDLLRHPIGFRIFGKLMDFVEPSAVAILTPIARDPRLGGGEGRVKLSTMYRVLRFFGPAVVRSIRNAMQPERARKRFDEEIESHLSTVKLNPLQDRFEYLRRIVPMLDHHISGALQFALPRFLPIFAPGMASFTLMHRLAGEKQELVLEITRGLPNNVTTEMDLALWEVARVVQGDPPSLDFFENNTAAAIADRYRERSLPDPAQIALNEFLVDYGMRGVGEIDMGRSRWNEDPTPVIQTLLSYIKLPPESAPDVIFERGKASATAATETIATHVRAQRGGWMKARIVRAAARRMRTLLGARESPKFFAIRIMGVLRAGLLNVGEKFVEAGTVDAADDLFYLDLDELAALGDGIERDWKDLIHRRRLAFDRESRRQLVPRVLLSDGRAFYAGLGAATDTGHTLAGSPVSPGVVEGAVRVVLDPHDTQLEPGEILVCPGTDPAWTPLFLAAGGLITEVGGMMTHGSVVAREYGIPAVVGVHEATHRLETGQKIRLDGGAGEITVLD